MWTRRRKELRDSRQYAEALTTSEERKIRMSDLRPISRVEKLVFPVAVTAVVGLIVPDALPLVGCLMFGNLLNVCGVTERLSKTAQNELMNIVDEMNKRY